MVPDNFRWVGTSVFTATAPSGDSPADTQAAGGAMITHDGEAKVVPGAPAATKLQEYDVALSFAGEDRGYVERVAQLLRDRDVSVFYDRFAEAELWGKDLYTHLSDLYTKRARFCVMFLSKAYASKAWTNHERAAAQQRAFEDRQDYILPARFDDTEIPGIRSTTGYVDLRNRSPEQLVDLILEKVRPTGAPPSPQPAPTIAPRLRVVAFILALAVATFGLVRIGGSTKTSVPRWLSAEFLPTMRELHRFADDLDSAWGYYAHQRLESADAFRRQLRDLTPAIANYNNALREFRVRQDDTRAQLTALSIQDVRLGVAAATVFDYAASKFQSFPEPPPFDPQASIDKQRNDLLSAWHSNAAQFRPRVEQLRSHVRDLQCEILLRAGAATSDCDRR
jgi:hypothetical protein